MDILDKQEIGNLVRRLQKGDMNAFGDLYERTYKYVIVHARIYTKSNAEDLVHDAYLKAFQKKDQIKNPEEFVAWLRTIVVNSGKNYSKRESKHKNESDIKDTREEDSNITETKKYSVLDQTETWSSEFNPEDIMDYQETKEIIWNCMERLPYKQKAAIDLYYFQEHSIDETAEIMGVAAGTVKSHLFQARQNLMKMIEEEERKSGVRMHCNAIILFPFLVWIFKQKEKEAVAGGVVPSKRVWKRLKRELKLGKPSITKNIKRIGIGIGTTAAVAAGVYTWNNTKPNDIPPETIKPIETQTQVTIEPTIGSTAEETLAEVTNSPEETFNDFPYTDAEIIDFIAAFETRRQLGNTDFKEMIDTNYILDTTITREDNKLYCEILYERNGNVTWTNYEVLLTRDFSSQPWKLYIVNVKEDEIRERQITGSWSGRMRVEDPTKEVLDPAYYADRDVVITIDSDDGYNIAGHMSVSDDVYGFYHETDIVGYFENEVLYFEMVTNQEGAWMTTSTDFRFYYHYDTDTLYRDIYNNVMARDIQ